MQVEAKTRGREVTRERKRNLFALKDGPWAQEGESGGTNRWGKKERRTSAPEKPSED